VVGDTPLKLLNVHIVDKGLPAVRRTPEIEARLCCRQKKAALLSSTDHGGWKRPAVIKKPDLDQCAGCARAERMDAARLPENVPTPTNSIAIFVVLCLSIFGLMAFAKFMERRGRKRLGNKVAKPSRLFQ
jgi:hypothetical protein